MGTHLRVLSESYQMNTNMTRFRWFCALDVSSHCVKMNKSDKRQTLITMEFLHPFLPVSYIFCGELTLWINFHLKLLRIYGTSFGDNLTHMNHFKVNMRGRYVDQKEKWKEWSNHCYTIALWTFSQCWKKKKEIILCFSKSTGLKRKNNKKINNRVTAV